MKKIPVCCIDVEGETFVNPQDLYYDSVAGCIFFSGLKTDTFCSAIGSYKFANDSLLIKKLSDYRVFVDLCSRTAGGEKTTLYIGDFMSGIDSLMWPSLDNQKQIAVGETGFPRISPDGKSLAWMEMDRPDYHKYKLVVFKLIFLS